MNNFLKKEKGISLVSLAIAIVILVVITNMILYNVRDNLVIEKLKNMQNDIENLTGKISNYYAEFGKVPTNSSLEYTNIQELQESGIISQAMDTGKFYVIDLEAMENVTLNYGKDYEKVNQTGQNINELEDIYIINENSHNIFYVEGVEIDDEIYYTNYTTDEVDQKAVDIRYVDNIKIPEEYKYKEGNLNNQIIIIKNDGSQEYKWVKIEEKIDNVPNGVSLDNELEFIKSVNLYKGYYENVGDANDIFCITLDESWSPTYDIDGEYKDKNGDVVIIPKGFQVSKKPGETKLDEGLVIKNEETDDRYVWVEVPKEIYLTAAAGEEYKNIENDMKVYTKEYRKEGYTDTWYEGCGLEEEEYNELKNTMLKSVYENEGFWISQYEIGANLNVAESPASDTRIAESKENLYVYNYVTCSKAQTLASAMDSAEKTSSLPFGIQWNLVLKFLGEKGNLTEDQLTKDSVEWGNYSNSTFYLTKGKYLIGNGWFYTDITTYTKPETSVLLTTGATQRNSCLNIYDLAGNISEWTLEKSDDTTNLSTARGGNHTTLGEVTVLERINSDVTHTNIRYGFRSVLY